MSFRAPPPDWARTLVNTAQKTAPVGDSTRWGAQHFQPLSDAVPEVVTPQILQVATSDPYARSWAMLGTLSLPGLTWNQSGLIVQLELNMGVGQITINQAIVLLHPALSTPPIGLPAVGRGGLCLQQNLYYGGPYGFAGETNEGGNVEVRGFSIIGGLIGHTISVRAHYQLTDITTPGLPCISRLAMIVTPFSAGEGL